MSRTDQNGCQHQPVRLANADMAVEVWPQLGAKIASLRTVSGREWMWRAPGNRAFRNQYGDNFEDGPLTGADECIPTIAPCSFRGRQLPDHGEAWTPAWEIDTQALAEGRIETALTLPLTPFRLTRVAVLKGSTLVLQYRLENLGVEREPYIWAFHPLLATAPGDEIQLPSFTGPMRVDTALGCGLGESGDSCFWPQPLSGMRLDLLEFGSKGGAVKLYSPPLSGGRVSAKVSNRRTGEALEIRFDTAENDTLGVWINQGAWGGFHHVALGPSCGAPDALNVAVEQWRRYATIESGEVRRWSLEVELTPPAKESL